MHCDADRFVLGLCDGNHCQSGDIGRERGNGRIVVALYRYGYASPCPPSLRLGSTKCEQKNTGWGRLK